MTQWIWNFTTFAKFQLTRSRGAWQFQNFHQTCGILFQLTRSRGAWHSIFLLLSKSPEFQLTRSRGAWLLLFLVLWVITLFQLTRSRGAWRIATKTIICTINYFNSHAHVERDIEDHPPIPGFPISTHTLTWSVTNWLTSIPLNCLFQLTRSRGAWLAMTI